MFLSGTIGLLSFFYRVVFDIRIIQDVNIQELGVFLALSHDHRRDGIGILRAVDIQVSTENHGKFVRGDEALCVIQNWSAGLRSTSDISKATYR